jgi:alpha-beta hydrolase superfamily lysophospholipase
MPADIEHEENMLEASDQVRLFIQYWKPQNPKAVLIMVHGLKDHSTRYAPVAQQLVTAGCTVYAFDLRGHGRSEGERGFVNSFGDYLRDFDLFYDQVRLKEQGNPIFLFGHSMGGAIALLFALTRNPGIQGLILTAPALKVGNDVSPLLVWFTKRLAGIAPKRPVFKLDNKLFPRDPEALATMNSDPLIYNKSHPARTAAELLRAIERIQKTMTSLTIPIIMMHGTADRITNPDGSHQLNAVALSKDKTLKLYEGHYHDLLHDLGNSDVANDLLQWLDRQLDASSRKGNP